MGQQRFSRVGVLKGGISSERGVSLDSGAAIAQGLRGGGYGVVEIDVESKDVQIPGGIEAVFIALHGRFGEDGEIQQRLAAMGIPFTGSGAEASRVSFDKVLTRKRLEANGVPVAKGEVIHSASERTIPVPLVVKPPREGSSVGCHLVFEEGGVNAAFGDASRFSDDVLVEEYIPGRELTVGIVESPSRKASEAKWQVMPVVEIKPKAEWYSFEAKYESKDTDYICPAELEPELAGQLQSIALKTFGCLGAEGFGRVDFRLSPQNEPYVLELNAIPGFTATSLLPKAAKAAGIGFSELCCRIMELAHL